MQLVTIEQLQITADNLANAKAIFEVGNNRCMAELRVFLQGNDCLGIHLGRHDTSMETRELENYLIAHKNEIQKQISSEVPRLRKEYRDALLASHADINWSAINS